MSSSFIVDHYYDAKAQTLTVTLKTGRRYIYLDVPAVVNHAFGLADSKGAFFNRYIRDCYTCREVSAANDA